MPHIIIETSEEIQLKQPKQLLKNLNQALFDTGHFTPANAIKSRIHAIGNSFVGVENSTSGFVAVQLYLMSGRDDATKQLICQTIVDSIEKHLKDEQIAFDKGFQITVNPIELDKNYIKKSL